MTRGTNAAEQRDEGSRQGRGSWRPKQKTLKDNEEYYAHIITSRDDLITVDFHQFMQTKDCPDGFPADKWPKKMFGICPRDVTFRLRDEKNNPTDAFEEGFGVCFLHDTYAGVKDERYHYDISVPTPLTVGLAVLRETLTDSRGNIIGFKDKTEEFTKDGVTHVIPQFVIIVERYRDVWHSIEASSFMHPRTIQDKDFRLARKGKDRIITPMTQTPEIAPGTPRWAEYEKSLELVGFTLEDWVVEHASLDHYRRWFIPGEEPEGGYGRGAGTEDEGAQPAAEVTGAETVDQAKADAFRARIAGRGAQPPAN